MLLSPDFAVLRDRMNSTSEYAGSSRRLPMTPTNFVGTGWWVTGGSSVGTGVGDEETRHVIIIESLLRVLLFW